MGDACWFCKERPAEETAGLLQTVIRPRALTEELREAVVTIARCSECRDSHEEPRASTGACLTALAGGLLGAGGGLAARAVEWSFLSFLPFSGWVAVAKEPAWTVALAGFALGVGLGGIAWTLGNARGVPDTDDHPAVAAILAEDPA